MALPLETERAPRLLGVALHAHRIGVKVRHELFRRFRRHETVHRASASSIVSQ